jgi:hypothetical protein
MTARRYLVAAPDPPAWVSEACAGPRPPASHAGNLPKKAQALRGACLPAKGAGTRAAPGGQFGARIYSTLSFAFGASVAGTPFRRPGRA